MTLGEFVKRERLRCGLSQDRLAVASGVPAGIIRKIEGGQNGCTLSTFSAFWRALAFDANEAISVIGDDKYGK